MNLVVRLMRIIEVKEDKKQYLDLLLLADEQENMIDRYLDKGKMYVLDDNGIKCECIVTDEGNDVLEIKNIATVPDYQGKGYAKSLIDFIVEKYREQYACLLYTSPEKQAKRIYARYYLGMAVNEIAEVEGLSLIHIFEWRFPILWFGIVVAFIFISAIVSVYAPAKRLRNMPITATINEL